MASGGGGAVGTFTAAQIGSSLAVTIGLGGTAGAAATTASTAGGNGGSGGASTVGSLVTAVGGGNTSILPVIPFEINTDSFLSMENNYNTPQWRVTGSNLPATFPSTGLPTCNAAAKGAIINVSGSASGKWQAACQGATPSWLYPDGTSAP